MGGLAADEGIFLPGNDVTKSKAEAAKAKGDEEELRFEMKGEPKDAKNAPLFSLDIFIMNR